MFQRINRQTRLEKQSVDFGQYSESNVVLFYDMFSCNCVLKHFSPSSTLQVSSSWGRLPIECWLPPSTLPRSWPTSTPASPKTRQWGTRTTVNASSTVTSVEPGSSWVSLTGLCVSLCSGNLFVVQWDKVRLKDREAEGAFTFQAALHRNGTIVFNYRDVGYDLSSSSVWSN